MGSSLFTQNPGDDLRAIALGYIADIPDLDACSAFAETPDQALTEVLVAKEVWIAAAKVNGQPTPSPEYRSVICRAA